MRALIQRALYLVRARQLDAELAEEMAFHQEMTERDLERQGIPSTEAATTARRRFGNRTLAQDQARDVWMWPWLQELLHDLRFASRLFAKDRWFTVTAVMTLAVGIAGVTVMFALINGVLLRPLPVAEQDRLLVAWMELRSTGFSHWPFGVPDIDVIGAASQTLERVAGVGHTGARQMVAAENGLASYVSVASVTGAFFGVLGVEPALGRALSRADDLSGAENVLVLTHALWQRRYGGSHGVIGRRVTVGQRPFTIVGVMPRGVEYPRNVEAWMTVAAHTPLLTNPAFRIDVDLIARMRPSVTIEQATGELQAATARLQADASAASTTRRGVPRGLVPVVHSFTDVVVGDVRPAMIVLFGAVGLVLLIASANGANLLLLRGEARRSELAVRAALGAGHGRLARLLLAESLVLAVAAAIIGLTVTWRTLQAVVALVPEGLPRVDSVRIDAGVVAFTTAVAFFTAALAGLTPALSATRIELAAQLRSGVRGATGGGIRHGRRALVVAQVALAVTIVAAAGLLMRSLVRLQTVDMGLAADRLILVELELPQAKYADPARHLQFLNDAIAQLEATPEIAAATPVHVRPFSGIGGWNLLRFTAEGQSEERATTNPSLNLESIHPNYFETFEVTLTRGRGFTGADRQGAPPVAIVSDDVAVRTWPGEDPIGKRIKFGGLSSTDPWRTVVGVTRPTRYRELVEPRSTLYLPAEQFIVAAHMLVLRTASAQRTTAALARERVQIVDPDVQVMRVVPFSELLDEPLARPRFNAFLLSLFGIAGLLLAAVGVYAVIAASVRQRHAEIGVRVALGATASDVQRLVLGEGLRLAGIGAAIGLVTAAMVTRVLQGLLFGVHPLDVVSLLTAAVLLVGTSALACYLPARRATRLDPATVLRAQ